MLYANLPSAWRLFRNIQSPLEIVCYNLMSLGGILCLWRIVDGLDPLDPCYVKNFEKMDGYFCLTEN